MFACLTVGRRRGLSENYDDHTAAAVSTWALLLDVALFLAELLITARRHSCAGFCVLLKASFSFSSNTEVSICLNYWCFLFPPFGFTPHDTFYRCTFRFQPASGLAYYTVQEQVAAILCASRTASKRIQATSSAPVLRQELLASYCKTSLVF